MQGAPTLLTVCAFQGTFNAQGRRQQLMGKAGATFEGTLYSTAAGAPDAVAGEGGCVRELVALPEFAESADLPDGGPVHGHGVGAFLLQTVQHVDGTSQLSRQGGLQHIKDVEAGTVGDLAHELLRGNVSGVEQGQAFQFLMGSQQVAFGAFSNEGGGGRVKFQTPVPASF